MTKQTGIYKFLSEDFDHRLAHRPISARLPIHVMSRIMAIESMFPRRSRSDILVELLKVGLESFEGELSDGFKVTKDNAEALAQDFKVGEHVPGSRERYKNFVEQHSAALDKEIATKSAKSE